MNAYLLEKVEINAVPLLFANEKVALFEACRDGGYVHGRAFGLLGDFWCDGHVDYLTSTLLLKILDGKKSFGFRTWNKAFTNSRTRVSVTDMKSAIITKLTSQP